MERWAISRHALKVAMLALIVYGDCMLGRMSRDLRSAEIMLMSASSLSCATWRDVDIPDARSAYAAAKSFAAVPD